MFQFLVDMNQWYLELPKVSRSTLYHTLEDSMSRRNRETIDQYYSSGYCIKCRTLDNAILCNVCRSDPPSALYYCWQLIRQSERKVLQLRYLTYSCCGPRMMRHAPMAWSCMSPTCPYHYAHVNAMRDLRVAQRLRDLLNDLFPPVTWAPR